LFSCRARTSVREFHSRFRRVWFEPEWHRVCAWSNLSKSAKILQKGQIITLEGTLRYREVEDDVQATPVKHPIAEIHASMLKRLSKIEASDDPTNQAGDE
jgi:single-strand DNA-binding protein